MEERPSIDITDKPELARLADEVAATGKPCALTRGEVRVALVVPLRRRAERQRKRHTELVDTSALPPVPFRTIDEILAARTGGPVRYFSDEKIEAALEQDRAEHWRKKLG